MFNGTSSNIIISLNQIGEFNIHLWKLRSVTCTSTPSWLGCAPPCWRAHYSLLSQFPQFTWRGGHPVGLSGSAHGSGKCSRKFWGNLVDSFITLGIYTSVVLGTCVPPDQISNKPLGKHFGRKQKILSKCLTNFAHVGRETLAKKCSYCRPN